MSLVTGSKLGPYEIVGPLGAGGMGEVYRARDTRFEKPSRLRFCRRSFPLIRSVDQSRLGIAPESRATRKLSVRPSD